MTVTSTVIGVAASMPVDLGAARNLAPTWVYLCCRAIVAVSRTFHEVILAIFFVKLFGFGPFAGFLALSVATIGFYAKLLAEDIESMDPSQAEAVRATGVGWFQWVNYAVQPQFMPRMIWLALYRVDINFRESAVVPIVGGGGIGATLLTAFDRYEFDSAAAILLIIIGIVMAMDFSSSWMRGRYSNADQALRRDQNLATPRAQQAARHLERMVRGSRDLRLLLAAYLGEDDLAVRHGRAPTVSADLAGRMVPPKWSYMKALWHPIWDTINIATLGTLIALVIAVPVAFCAARNTTPSHLFVRPVALFTDRVVALHEHRSSGNSCWSR